MRTNAVNVQCFQCLSQIDRYAGNFYQPSIYTVPNVLHAECARLFHTQRRLRVSINAEEEHWIYLYSGISCGTGQVDCLQTNLMNTLYIHWIYVRRVGLMPPVQNDRQAKCRLKIMHHRVRIDLQFQFSSLKNTYNGGRTQIANGSNFQTTASAANAMRMKNTHSHSNCHWTRALILIWQTIWK